MSKNNPHFELRKEDGTVIVIDVDRGQFDIDDHERRYSRGGLTYYIPSPERGFRLQVYAGRRGLMPAGFFDELFELRMCEGDKVIRLMDCDARDSEWKDIRGTCQEVKFGM